MEKGQTAKRDEHWRGYKPPQKPMSKEELQAAVDRIRASGSKEELQAAVDRIRASGPLNDQSRLAIITLVTAFMGILDEDTELIQMTPIRAGRTLREFADHTPKATLYAMQFGDHTPAAREAFADLDDYLHDYHQLNYSRHSVKQSLRNLLEETNGQCTMKERHDYHRFAKESLRRDLEVTRTFQRTMKFGDTSAAREAFAELDASATEQIGVDAHLDALLVAATAAWCESRA